MDNGFIISNQTPLFSSLGQSSGYKYPAISSPVSDIIVKQGVDLSTGNSLFYGILGTKTGYQYYLPLPVFSDVIEIVIIEENGFLIENLNQNFGSESVLSGVSYPTIIQLYGDTVKLNSFNTFECPECPECPEYPECPECPDDNKNSMAILLSVDCLNEANSITVLPNDIDPLLLLNNNRSLKVQTSTNSQHITFSFAENQTIQVLHIAQHNLSSNATISLACFDNIDGTGAQLASQTVNAHQYLIENDFFYEEYQPNISIFADWEPNEYFSTILLNQEVSCRSITVDINDSTEFQLGRIMAGKAIQPLYNPVWGLSLQWMNTKNEFKRTLGGSIRFQTGGKRYRMISLRLEHLTFRERAFWQQLGRQVHQQTIYLNCYPDVGGAITRDYEMICQIVEFGGMENSNVNKFVLPLKFEEI